jgi:hypothetical protein
MFDQTGKHKQVTARDLCEAQLVGGGLFVRLGG